MITVQVDKALHPTVDRVLLEQSARYTLEGAHPPGAASLTIVITSDEQLQQLNRQYLGIDAPTDVLSFPAGDVDPDSGGLYLGDVLISLPRALAQADAGGHALTDELQLLTVHGVLHLLGHDHAEPDETQAMQTAQSAILQRLGCAINPPLGG